MTITKPLRWLHISDIHAGSPGREVWWHVNQAFARSIQESVSLLGMPDLILITGDIAWSGQKEQYETFDAFLDQLLGWLTQGGGSTPLIIPVPGNHDLDLKCVDTNPLLGLFGVALGKETWPAQLPILEQLTWQGGGTTPFHPLFQNYLDWFNRRVLPGLPSTCRLSPFPGDISVQLNLPGKFPLTVVGINSAWMHYQKENFHGKLELLAGQLQAALADGSGSNPLDAIQSNALLLMHHPLDWFSLASRKRFNEEIYPPDRFLACLHGHMHYGRSETTVISGGWPRHFFQAPSLFGLEKYGTTNESRAMGYAWGELDASGGMRVWPMAYRVRGDGSGAFVFDQSFVGDMRTGLVLRQGKPQPAKSSVSTPPAVVTPTADGAEEGYYRTWALTRYGHVSMIGTGGADLTLDLAKVYVPLRISQRSTLADPDRRKDRPAKNFHEQSDGEVALTDVFRQGQGRHMALFGDPGAGKSTAMRKLLHHCLTDGPQVLGLAAQTLPIFLRLRRFTEPFLQQSLAVFIQNELAVESGHSLPAGLGERLWQRGGLLLLFDGLDEIADAGLRARVARKLDHALLNERSRGIHAAVSCRYAGYGDRVRLGGSFLHLDVRPLDDHQVAHFVRLWFQEAHRCLPKGSADQAAQEATKLLRNLGEARYANQQIKLLVGNPLLLTLLCVVVLQKYEIPRRRVEFYRQCLEVLLYRWRYLLEEEAPPLNLELSLAVLREMAWEMHSKGRQYDFSQEEFITLAAGVLDRQGTATVAGGLVLRWLHVTCGVLEEYSPKCYGLMHLGFQEYLAACHVAAERDTKIRDLVARSGERWWKEVILLLAGLEDKDLFVRLVKAFLPEIAEKEEMLREILGEAPVVDLSPFLERLEQRPPAEQAAILRVLKGRSHSTLQEIERKLARQVTDRVIPMQAIIEPKTGIRLLPIPGGEFIMGSMDGDKDERPPHPVKLSPYLLAETPVTNRQYGIYLQETQAKEPEFWRDRRFADPEQPVVGVDRQEAMAFCQWLAKGSGQIFTLPSEAQWEFAARGTDGRNYPWGHEKPTRELACFGQDGSTGKPVPVGSHPGGRGPFGHLDLAGNVWEWCLDSWTDDYAQWNGATPTDPVNISKNVLYVMRGGAWRVGAGALRSACRGGPRADGRYGSVGFRLAAAPASTLVV